MTRPRPAPAGLPSAAHTRLAASVPAGVAAGLAVGLPLGRAGLGVLAGIAVMGLVFVTWSLRVLWGRDAADTRRTAVREDLDPRVEELAVAAAAVASLVVIVVVLVAGAHDRQAAAAVGLAGVALSWAMLHLMYAARYAHEYYSGAEGGIDWNDERFRPAYRDFLYFSYNLGMTYQVSDTSVSSPAIRAVVLRHCLLSYAFGTGILATTINLLVGVVGG